MPEAPEQIFDISQLDHDRVKKFKPEFVAKGGVNLVYSLAGYPNLMAKADQTWVMWGISANVEKGRPIDSYPFADGHYNRNSVSRNIEEDQQRIRQAQSIFGAAHIPAETVHFLKVPVSRKAVDHLINKGRENNPASDWLDQLDSAALDKYWKDTVWTKVLIQEKVEGLEKPGVVKLRGSYGEVSTEPKYQIPYQIATDRYFVSPGPDRSALLDLMDVHPPLRDTWEKTVDPKFKRALKDFTKKAMEFTQKTGEPMDLMGTGNVFFLPHLNGTWDYKIVDFLVPDRPPSVINQTYAEFVAKNIRVGQWHGATAYITQMVNYVRIINGLAEMAGIGERVHLLPEGVTVNPVEMLFRLRDERMPTDKPSAETPVMSRPDFK